MQHYAKQQLLNAHLLFKHKHVFIINMMRFLSPLVYLACKTNCYNKNITKMDKQNVPLLSSPLRQKHQNLKNAYSRQDSKQHKHDEVLMAIEDEISLNASCDLFDVILTDPLLKELNTSLQIEAQQKKKNKLLESFPLRYRNLVQTETLYKKLQENLKEAQQQSKEVKQMQKSQRDKLLSSIETLKNSIRQKNHEIQTLKTVFQNEKMEMSASYQQALQEKSQQIFAKADQVNEMERKMIKVKCEKENLIQYLQQLKEESELLKKQNERIIKVVTSHELQINRLNETLRQNQESYKENKQKLIEELMKTQIQCKEQLDSKELEYNSVLLDKERLTNINLQMQGQIRSQVSLRQNAQKDHLQKMDDIKAKLQQSIQTNIQLQSSFQGFKRQNQQEIEGLQQKNAQLNQELINKNIQIQERTLNFEIQLHKVRESHRKLSQSKDQTIEQIRQNVNLITEEKLFMQGKLLKVEAQKESLINQVQKLKNDIEILDKRIIEMSFQSRRHLSKNVEVQKMADLFKVQLDKFKDIITQKQQKIQQYRKNIMNLRSKVTDALAEKATLSQELEIYVNKNSILISQVDRLSAELSKCNTKEYVLEEQIQGFSKIINKKKEQKGTQVEILQGINDEQAIKLSQIHKKLNKTQQKYENILEQLQQYKKQYKEDLAQKQKVINSLRNDNKNMKDMIGNKINQNTDIEKLISGKIQQLKAFYEKKMVEEDKKYRTTIEVLKKEVIELYKQIDLKKSMEEEMFNEIMKINKERNLKKSEIQL